MCVLDIGLMKSGRAAWQEEEDTRKKISIALTLPEQFCTSELPRSFRTQSYGSFTTGQCRDSGRLATISLPYFCDVGSMNQCDNGVAFPALRATRFTFVLELLTSETDGCPILGVFNLSNTLRYDLIAVFMRCRSMNQCGNGVAFPALRATRFTFCASAPDRRNRCWSNA